MKNDAIQIAYKKKIYHEIKSKERKVLMQIPEFLEFVDKSEDYYYHGIGYNTHKNKHVIGLNFRLMPDLHEFPKNFGKLTHLRYLEISRLDSSNPDLFSPLSQLPHLEHLSIEDDNITHLPKSLTKLTQITHLTLSCHKLKALPADFATLTGLTYLDLSGPSFKNFPGSITKLQNLTTLKISSLMMPELPSSIKNLHHLEILEIQHSQFHSIPESLGDLQSLKDIWISNTPISQLPEFIGNLHNLESLIISFYRQNNSQPEIEKIKDYMISRLPESFGNLHNLKKLKFSDIPLTHLPMSFGNLKNLRDLTISHTDLTSLPESFHNFPHLKNLDLSHNHLESLSPVFYPFPALKDLHLWDNSLRSLHFLTDLEKYKCYGGFRFGISDLCLTPTGFRLLNAIPEMSRSIFHGDQIYPIRVSYDHHLNYPDDFTFEIDSTNFSNDQVKALYLYYKKSVRELAEQYMDDPDSLTVDERERLVHEATHEWFIVLSANLEPSNPVLKKIQERFQIKRDDGFTILL